MDIGSVPTVVEVASGEHGENLDALVNAVQCSAADEPSDDLDGGRRGADAEETERMLPPRRTSISFDPALPPPFREKDKHDVILEVDRRRPSIVPAAAAVTSAHPVPFWVQFSVLLRRSLLLSWRDMVSDPITSLPAPHCESDGGMETE